MAITVNGVSVPQQSKTLDTTKLLQALALSIVKLLALQTLKTSHSMRD